MKAMFDVNHQKTDFYEICKLLAKLKGSICKNFGLFLKFSDSTIEPMRIKVKETKGSRKQVYNKNI